MVLKDTKKNLITHEISRRNATLKVKSLLLDQDIFILYGRAFQDNAPKIAADLFKSGWR